MSGGVDSSVAALLMQKQGFTCVGVTMKLFENEDIGKSRQRTCCSLEDVEDARNVCFRLGIPHYVFGFSDDFRKTVIARFVQSYQQGFTPNPCIDCNRYIKFDRLFHRMRQMQMDAVVTGHYARIEREEASGKWLLKKGMDPAKDQSYVLYAMTQDQLAHIRFPLGYLQKSEVRRIARENGLDNAAKRESQDICFVPDGDYGAFLERYTGKTMEPGNFVRPDGTVLGQHRGIGRYTIGQKKGLGLSVGRPLYVCDICPQSNTVVLGEETSLYGSYLTAKEVNLISGERLDKPIRVCAKIRYRQQEQPAEAWQSDDGRLHVRFDQPQRAITPGQSVVLYDGDTVLGGGTIERAQ